MIDKALIENILLGKDEAKVKKSLQEYAVTVGVELDMRKKPANMAKELFKISKKEKTQKAEKPVIEDEIIEPRFDAPFLDRYDTAFTTERMEIISKAIEVSEQCESGRLVPELIKIKELENMGALISKHNRVCFRDTNNGLYHTFEKDTCKAKPVKISRHWTN